MNTFTLKISSPDGDVFAGEAVMITLRGASGDLAVLSGHAPLITSVKPCDVKITLPDETEKTGETDGGILTVRDNIVTLLSGSFKMKV